ncbi:MAG: DUF4276 family protein [Planctomycetes bacterium]|nr:DUF4276 family protein [Planctomycetota bacterium]
MEGGGDSKQLHTRCREGFRRLLDRCGFCGRMPRLVACGSRSATFGDFKTAHDLSAPGEYVAMLVDSEDAVEDIEQTWNHLKNRDGWERLEGASDEQVLLMVTCMETRIVADRAVLKSHYGAGLQENALPPLINLESRAREDIHTALTHATRDFRNAYTKGKRSFEVLGKLTPATLTQHLPSFQRLRRVLDSRL